MRDCAGVAVRFVRGTPPPGVVGSRSSSPSSEGTVLDTAESPTAAESPPTLSRTGLCRNRAEVVEVDAIPAELLLDERAFVVGVDVCRREQRSAQSKKVVDSSLNVAADPIRVSAAHQARAPHLADPPRTRAAGEISVHALLLSV